MSGCHLLFVFLFVQCQRFAFSPVNLDIPYPVQPVLMCINYVALSGRISKLRIGSELLSFFLCLIDYLLRAFKCIYLYVRNFLLLSECLFMLFIFYKLCSIKKFLDRPVLQISSSKVNFSSWHFIYGTFLEVFLQWRINMHVNDC